MPLTLTVGVAKEAPRGASIGIAILAGKKGPELPASVAATTSSLAARGFEAKLGQVIALTGRGATQILVGLGDPSALTVDSFRSAAAALVRAAFGEAALATALIDSAPARLERAAVAQAVTEGVLLASYQFTVYKSQPLPRALQRVIFTGRGGRLIGHGVARGQLVSEAVALNRDLVNQPPAGMTPRQFATIAMHAAEAGGVAITVWDEQDIERERLGGLRGVSLGSDEPPRLIKFVYTPTNASARTKLPTLALVGKGITFDSGGLSLKPSDSMITMKSDMSGAGAVLSVMSIIGRLEPACRVIGYCCVTENMPGPSAFKLGDVLTARNGKTVEIHNTDAEGRLVLMDGLSLAAEDRPDAIVDLATLTGAQIVALGMDITAIMGNNESLSAQVQAAAKRAGEEMWPLPLPPKYRKHLDSSIADMKNIGNPGQAGSSVAGLFLQEFVDGRPWVHLDIAGPSFTSGDEGINTKGGTGVAVRTLIELIESFEPPAK